MQRAILLVLLLMQLLASLGADALTYIKVGQVFKNDF
jgi:hypothetical protein